MKFKGIFINQQNQEFMTAKLVKIRLFFIIFAISCLYSQINAQKLSVHLEGYYKFTLDEIDRLIINLPEYENDSTNYIKKLTYNVEKLHINHGFYFSTIDSIKKNQTEINIYGNSGKQVFLNKISWLCSNSLQKKLGIDEVLYLPGDIFYPEIIDRISLDILNTSSSKGYPFLSIEPELKFITQSDSIFVDVEISVSDTQSVTLSGIISEGNEKVEPSVISKISGVGNHSFYSDDQAKLIQTRLIRSGLFETVEIPNFQIKGNNDYKWYVKVKEKLSNQFDGILGYIPGKTSGESGYFTGIVDIYLRNFLGNARKLNFKWLRETKDSQEINFFFSEPWVLDYPIEATIDFNQRNQDSTYIRRKIEYSSNFKFWDEWTVSSSLYTEFILGLTDQSSQSQSTEIFNTDKYLFGIGILYDTRDNIFNPRNGLALSIKGKWGIKKIVGPDSSLKYYSGKLSGNIQVSQFQFEFFKSITNRQVLELKAKLDQIESNSLQLPDLFFLGGIQNLRGYRENQFQGNLTAVIGTEYRFLISDQSYFLCFVDCGYIKRQAFPEIKLNSLKEVFPSYGAGALLNSAIGNVKVIFAFGKGDTFSTAKVHFGIQNNF